MNQGSIKSWPCILLSVTRAVSEGSDISFPFLFSIYHSHRYSKRFGTYRYI